MQPGRDYSTDLHTVEVGFSPTDNLNGFIKAHPSMSSFNIDEYIGDPSLAYSSSYASLDDLADTVFTSGSSYVNVYNAFDFVRLIKFFDNSLFRIIKDFVPARSNISTGIVIKPHLLDRSKIKQPEVKWSNQTSPDFIHTGTQLDYTGSYYSTNFSIDGNIETAFITGSTGPDSGYTSSYTETYANPSGGFQTLTRNNHDEASYTGEYSGSIVKVSNAELNEDNLFKSVENSGFYFNFFPSSSFTSLSSFIQSDFSSTNNVTLWVSQSIVSNYTSSTIEALAIPTVSPNAGNIANVLENATEVVFEYVKFITTNEFVTSPRRFSFVNNLGQELQDENIQLSVSENTSNSTHEITFKGDEVGQATEYSASLEIDFADIPNNTQVDIPFDYEVLHTSQGGTESKLIIQLRDKTTDTSYSGMSFALDMNDFETGTELLTFKNETGSTLQNVEFLFRVTVENTGNPPDNIPRVSIRGLKANYKGDGEGYYNSGIETRKKLKDAYYYKLADVITIPTSSAELGVASSQQYNVGLLPEPNELFRFNDFAPTSNNVDSVRKSTIRLVVDERSYAPTQGIYEGFFLPGNYEIISSSIANGVEGLDERFFAEVQDSNYSSTGWRNGRYDGTKTTDIINNVRVLGQEPALTYNSFEGSLFDSSSISSEIKTKFSGSEEKTGDIEVYYNTFELDAGNTLSLSNISSVENNSTRTSFDITTYAFDLGNNDVGGGTYQGFIGPKVSTDEIVVVFDVTLNNLSVPDLDVAGLAVNILASEDNSVLDQSSFVGTDFTHGGTVTKTITLEPSRNTSNATLQFVFSNFEGDTGGGPDVTLNITSIKRFSLLPVHSNKENIIQLDGAGRTIMYSKVSPTPTSPNGFVPIVASKLFRFGNSTVYTTNDKGIVTNIE